MFNTTNKTVTAINAIATNNVANKRAGASGSTGWGIKTN